jgi:hypothetical protein
MGKMVTFPKGPHPSTRTLAMIRDDVGEIFKMLKAEREHRTGNTVAISELVPTDLLAVMSLLGLRYEELEELGGVRLGNPWAAQDATVAGMFTFVTRTVTVAKGQPPAQRRYTTAHEIAHALYDAGIVQLRERGISASERLDPEQKSQERTADLFAAEILMPTDLMRDAMIKRFGSPIDGTVPDDDLAYFLSVAMHEKFAPTHLARLPQHRRAALFAVANNYRGKHFIPLIDQFDVSMEAMAKRLMELGLVM